MKKIQKQQNLLQHKILMDERLYTKALKFLSRRPRSEKEVRDNLKKKKAPQAKLELIIDVLKEQKFLDDTEFAKWWIEQRTNFNTKGWRVIEIELKNKGISSEIIEELRISKLELRGDNELQIAQKLVEKRINKYHGLSRQEIYQKLGGFLARRGFDLDTIKTCIDHIHETERG